VAQVTVSGATAGGCASATGTNSSGTAVSAGTTTYTATACSTYTTPCPTADNITDYVGPFSWTVTPSTVGIADTTGASCTNSSFTGTCSTSSTACYTCVVTAGAPGIANVIAAVQGVASLPSSSATFETCPVASITLSDSSTGTNTGTPTPVSIGSTVALKTVVTDSAGITLSDITPVYNSSQPGAVSPRADSISIAAGDANVVASCTPPTCNDGFYPIFSNPYLIQVLGTTSTTVLATSTTAPPSGKSSYLVPIPTSTNVPSTPLSLPNLPNSMIVSSTGGQVIIGSTNPGTYTGTKPGVMVVDISTASITTTGFWGRVLAISPDGDKAVIFDAGPTPIGTFVPTLYIYSISENSTSSVAMNDAFGVAFTPDSSRAYIVGTNTTSTGVLNSVLVVVAPGTTPVINYLGPVSTDAINDVDFLAQGSLAFLAGGGSSGINTYASCNNTFLSGISTPGTPVLIRAIPNALGAPAAGSAYSTYVVAADPPFLDVFKTTLNAPVGGTTASVPTLATCQPSYSNSGVTPESWTGISSFTAGQLLVAPNSSYAFILPGNQPDVLAFNVANFTASASPITSTVALTGTSTVPNPLPYTGGITLDSASLYLGANDGYVHQINVSTLKDEAQIAVTFTGCSTSTTTCYPDLVAVVP
jgi:hypothetical protein